MRSAPVLRSRVRLAWITPRGWEANVAALGIALAALFVAVDGVNEARTAPLYGLLDEVAHIGYAIAVADSGVPPMLGRDRIFVGGTGAIAPRDVRVPPAESGSTGLPLGPNSELAQTEAIQPPGAYYALAPVAALTNGRDRVVALRIACALALALTVIVLGWFVWSLTALPLAGALAAVALTSCGGLIRVDSWVTNGSFVILGAGVVILALLDAFRQRVMTVRLSIAAAFLAIAHLIVVPLAMAAVLIAGARAWNSGRRRRVVGLTLLAAAPLALWVMGNLIRYHWPVPRNVQVAGRGPGSSISTEFLKPGYIASNAYVSLSGGFNGALQYWKASPFVYDWRPIGILLPVALLAVGFCLHQGRRTDRIVIGSLLIAFVGAHVGVFAMLWLSIVTQGAGDYVFRYFGPTFFVGSAIVGAAAGLAVSRYRTGSLLLVALCSTLLAFNIQSSPL